MLNSYCHRYPESHQVLGNHMFDASEPDPDLSAFHLGNKSTTLQSKWWNTAEPIWTTATKSNKRVYLRYWSRCDVPFDGILPEVGLGYGGEKSGNDVKDTFDIIPAKIHHNFSLVMAHVDFLDLLGHKHGPDSKHVLEGLKNLDQLLGKLQFDIGEDKLNNTVMSSTLRFYFEFNFEILFECLHEFLLTSGQYNPNK